MDKIIDFSTAIESLKSLNSNTNSITQTISEVQVIVENTSNNISKLENNNGSLAENHHETYHSKLMGTVNHKDVFDEWSIWKINGCNNIQSTINNLISKISNLDNSINELKLKSINADAALAIMEKYNVGIEAILASGITLPQDLLDKSFATSQLATNMAETEQDADNENWQGISDENIKWWTDKVLKFEKDPNNIGSNAWLVWQQDENGKWVGMGFTDEQTALGYAKIFNSELINHQEEIQQSIPNNIDANLLNNLYSFGLVSIIPSNQDFNDLKEDLANIRLGTGKKYTGTASEKILVGLGAENTEINITEWINEKDGSQSNGRYTIRQKAKNGAENEIEYTIYDSVKGTTYKGECQKGDITLTEDGITINTYHKYQKFSNISDDPNKNVYSHTKTVKERGYPASTDLNNSQPKIKPNSSNQASENTEINITEWINEKDGSQSNGRYTIRQKVKNGAENEIEYTIYDSVKGTTYKGECQKGDITLTEDGITINTYHKYQKFSNISNDPNQNVYSHTKTPEERGYPASTDLNNSQPKIKPNSSNQASENTQISATSTNNSNVELDNTSSKNNTENPANGTIDKNGTFTSDDGTITINNYAQANDKIPPELQAPDSNKINVNADVEQIDLASEETGYFFPNYYGSVQEMKQHLIDSGVPEGDIPIELISKQLDAGSVHLLPSEDSTNFSNFEEALATYNYYNQDKTYGEVFKETYDKYKNGEITIKDTNMEEIKWPDNWNDIKNQ